MSEQWAAAGLRTWWYCMDTNETIMWDHPRLTVRLKFRRQLFLEVASEATSKRRHRMFIFDNQETPVAEHQLRPE